MKLSLDSQDWKKLLDSNDDDGDPPALVVTKTGADDRTEIDSGESNRFLIDSMTDSELAQAIESKRRTYATTARLLPDKGQKVLDMITSFEKEKERREKSPLVLKDTRSVEMEEDRHRRNWRTVKVVRVFRLRVFVYFMVICVNCLCFRVFYVYLCVLYYDCID